MTVNFDMPLDGAESDSQTTSPAPSPSHQPVPENVSALISEPLAGGIVPVLPFLSGEHPDWELWNIEELLDLDTVWQSAYGFVKAKDMLPAIHKEISDEPTGMYKLLEDSMRKNGQQAPIRLFKKESQIRDGIHRLIIAYVNLGWPVMLTSTESSFWTEWDNSEQGKEYDRLKRERFGLR